MAGYEPYAMERAKNEVPTAESPSWSDPWRQGMKTPDDVAEVLSVGIDGRARLYRLRAAECLDLAERSPSNNAKRSFVEMAAAWRRLAELAEKRTEVPT
jgi:hypothetical protein